MLDKDKSAGGKAAAVYEPTLSHLSCAESQHELNVRYTVFLYGMLLRVEMDRTELTQESSSTMTSNNVLYQQGGGGRREGKTRRKLPC